MKYELTLKIKIDMPRCQLLQLKIRNILLRDQCWKICTFPVIKSSEKVQVLPLKYAVLISKLLVCLNAF